jgi:hypothetical protein
MKTALALLAFVALNVTASAIEYKTLFAGEEHEVNPSSLVELQFRAQGNISGGVSLYRGETQAQINHNIQGVGEPFPVTGITKVKNGASGVVTLKITPKSEINVVAPGTVLVLPENVTGNFDVVIEASDDLVSWMPFFSQTVNAATAKKFFRTRVVKTPTP